jgi:hypothetical protein
VRDVDYMLAVKTLCCAAFDIDGDMCAGPVHAHHAGVRGLGTKADDDTCVPMCLEHHGDWHDGRGPFARMTKAERAEWIAAAIVETRRQVEIIRGRSEGSVPW